jgi:hypothetical protein
MIKSVLSAHTADRTRILLRMFNGKVVRTHLTALQLFAVTHRLFSVRQKPGPRLLNKRNMDAAWRPVTRRSIAVHSVMADYSELTLINLRPIFLQLGYRFPYVASKIAVDSNYDPITHGLAVKVAFCSFRGG